MKPSIFYRKGVMYLNNILFYPIGCSDSCRAASAVLKNAGFSLTDHPAPEVTHLLLDVPSFDTSGLLKDGSDLEELLRMLPKSLTIIGGNLNQDFLQDYRTVDLLQDPYYLAKNAAITAECALRVAAPYLHTTFADSPALILGWGRIGKMLSRMLSAMGCPVTVAARKDSDRAMLGTLGFRAVEFSLIPNILGQYTVLFNTVPDLPLQVDGEKLIAIDLASYPGMSGSNVIPARGLPGKYTPESSGKLIANSILKLFQEEVL